MEQKFEANHVIEITGIIEEFLPEKDGVYSFLANVPRISGKIDSVPVIYSADCDEQLREKFENE